jgi:hypothetical protein
MSSSESQIPSGRGVITYRILRVVEHVNAIGGIVEKTLSGMTDSTTTIAGDAERESHEIQVPVDEMIRSACKDELEIGFGRIVPQIMEGISASIRQELHSVSRVQVVSHSHDASYIYLPCARVALHCKPILVVLRNSRP